MDPILSTDRSFETLNLTSRAAHLAKTPRRVAASNENSSNRNYLLPMDQQHHFDALSIPLTTTSMQDYFDKCQNIESSKPPDIEEE